MATVSSNTLVKVCLSSGKCVQPSMTASGFCAICVAAGATSNGQVTPHDGFGDGAIVPAFLRKRNKQLTSQFIDGCLRVLIDDRVAIRAEAYSSLGRQHEVLAAWPCAYGGSCAWINNANDRQRRHLLTERIQRDSRSRIARHHQQFDVAVLQLPGRISEVNKVLIRQLLSKCLENSQAPDSGVEYPDWQPFCVRCVHPAIVLWNNPAPLSGTLSTCKKPSTQSVP